MTSLATAKALLYIALSYAPPGAHTLLATSNSENYVWTQGGDGWSLKVKGLPASDYKMDPDQMEVPRDARAMDTITERQHGGTSVTYLGNGNRIEVQSAAVLYIVDPGAPNEKVYTIIFPQDQK